MKKKVSMSKQAFRKLRYVDCFVPEPPKDWLERLKASKLFQLLLTAFHICLEEPSRHLYYHPVAVDIFEILLELSTVSLSDEEKYQEAAERYYLLETLPYHQWSWHSLSQKSHSDQIIHIGEVLARWSKPFDTSLINQVRNLRLFVY